MTSLLLGFYLSLRLTYGSARGSFMADWLHPMVKWSFIIHDLQKRWGQYHNEIRRS